LQRSAERPACIEADVRDIAGLAPAFHDRPITGVVHCAGLKAVGEAEERRSPTTT
jgi:UDP-glucose 4-epimerase